MYDILIPSMKNPFEGLFGKKGKFIVFEGGEGSGKSTQAKLLVERLKKEGKNVIYTKEPGGTPVADKIREIFLYQNTEPVVPKTELFLLLASRAQHVTQKIAPALKEGTHVICDRFSGSTYAYQIGARKMPNGTFIEAMDAYARDGLEPDQVLFIDVDPEVGISRKQKGDEELTRMDKEELDFHRKVRGHFKKLAKHNDDTWVEFDGNLPIQDLHVLVYDKVSKLLV